MYKKTRNCNSPGETSTPKRRRLGQTRILRPTQNINRNTFASQNLNTQCLSPLGIQDDPPLPCNQVEYLCDSDSNCSTSSDIPCSPAGLNFSIKNSLKNWDSLIVSKVNNLSRTSESICREINEIEEISDQMFISKLEQGFTQDFEGNVTLMTSKLEKNFRDDIEDSFDMINQSICHNSINKSSLFETKDSFLLDIKESGIVLQEEIKSNVILRAKNNILNKDSFYGLPMITKGLFKTYRNIEKFYDWQEDCLSLPAIADRQNLIYALPTSGGKTLVAEVLMLREVLCRKKNALFILPFVAIVQEKMWSLSPFAVQLDFLIEEYAGGKGHMPPKKRRKKNSIYIATIEKGLALIRSLIELDRLDELGLIVVDELHLIGEPGRGGTLETLLTTIMFTKKDIQLVGMSATIGNLPDIAKFLQAEIFQRQFRPVELTEYVKLGDVLHRLVCGDQGLEVIPDRQLAFDYTPAATNLDPDFLGGLVSEVVPKGACLVFCPTKKNCENVASLLCKLQRKEMTLHRTSERQQLQSGLSSTGASSALVRAVLYGVAYHHAGLAADERAMIEHAYRSGVISVICCTSTLAAGVNLPASRVIVRAPAVGCQPITLPAYRQMTGRAGRAGVCDTGESIIICGPRDWPQLKSVLQGGMPPARSVLISYHSIPGLSNNSAISGLILSALALRLCKNSNDLLKLLECTLLAKEDYESPPNMREICDEALNALIDSKAVETANCEQKDDKGSMGCIELRVSTIGQAAIKGCIELPVAQQFLKDLKQASKSLVLMGSLHLLYLVTPHDAAGVRPDYRHYYSLYCNLSEEGIQTAKVLGITEMNAIRMMTGKPITNVSEIVLRRFYLALMLHDLWNEVPFSAVAEKYNIPRGTVQSIMSASSSFAWSVHRVCCCVNEWSFETLFEELARRLQTCACPELRGLMDLPMVHKARAMQLYKAGYKRIEDIAKASVEDLVSSITHLTRKAANLLVNSARIMLIEKVENLRAEAEDVMEELNM